MKTVELLPLTADITSFNPHRLAANIALHYTAAGEGHACIVASALRKVDASAAAREMYSGIAYALHDGRMAIVHERIFGSLSAEPNVLRERKNALSASQIPAESPITYVAGDSPWGEGLSGVIIHAVSRDDVWTIMDGDVACGRGWRRNDATYLQLQNIQQQAGNRPDQVREILENTERILRLNGASFKDVARTWFYLSDILDWYPEFNKARSEKYGEFGIMPCPSDTRLLLPASTGIGADTPSGAAASMDLLAVIGNDDATSPVRKLTNRKQLDAFRYGAAFSRGAVIEEDDVSLIEISGTAAIDEHGVSLYPGNVRSQIDCTFDKVDSLLAQEGSGLADICAATVFVKRPEYAPIFREMARDRGLSDFPAVCIVADVCRKELLFEMDAEAVMKQLRDRKASNEITARHHTLRCACR